MLMGHSLKKRAFANIVVPIKSHHIWEITTFTQASKKLA